MSRSAGPKPPTWFWIVAVLLLLWEVMGCLAYVSQVSMGPAELARLPEAQQRIWTAMPAWTTGAYAIAVWIGLFGGIALLARRHIAIGLFLVSLIAVLVQFGWVFIGGRAHATLGPSAAAFPAFIVAVGLFSIWFAKRAADRQWIR